MADESEGIAAEGNAGCGAASGSAKNEDFEVPKNPFAARFSKDSIPTPFGLLCSWIIFLVLTKNIWQGTERRSRTRRRRQRTGACRSGAGSSTARLASSPREPFQRRRDRPAPLQCPPPVRAPGTKRRARRLLALVHVPQSQLRSFLDVFPIHLIERALQSLRRRPTIARAAGPLPRRRPRRSGCLLGAGSSAALVTSSRRRLRHRPAPGLTGAMLFWTGSSLLWSAFRRNAGRSG